MLVILTPQAMTDPTATAQAVGVARRAHKPVLAAWMGGRVVGEGIQMLNEAGIPTYTTPKKPCRRSCTWSPTPAISRSSTKRRATFRWTFTLDRQRLRGV